MSLILMLAAVFALLLVMTFWRSQVTVIEPALNSIDSAALDDPILAYHLDCAALHDDRFRFYLFVKQVNAVKRYEDLTGVSHEQAAAVIDYLITHTDWLQRLRPLKKRPALPAVEERRLRDLIASGQSASAERLYQQLADVDLFTAQRAIARLEREVWVDSLDDPDIGRLLDNSETAAIDLARRRYGLSQKEAVQVIDIMHARNPDYSE